MRNRICIKNSWCCLRRTKNVYHCYTCGHSIKRYTRCIQYLVAHCRLFIQWRISVIIMEKCTHVHTGVSSHIRKKDNKIHEGNCRHSPLHPISKEKKYWVTYELFSYVYRDEFAKINGFRKSLMSHFNSQIKWS